MVPNCALGKVTSGAFTWLAIRLFQYCHPTVNWLMKERGSWEFRVKFAICRWLVVKLPSSPAIRKTRW